MVEPECRLNPIQQSSDGHVSAIKVSWTNEWDEANCPRALELLHKVLASNHVIGDDELMANKSWPDVHIRRKCVAANSVFNDAMVWI